MTHEELLAKIDEKIESVESMSLIIAVSWRALRAVVELHEPTPYGHDTWQACMECSCQDCNTFIVYPCPTIQAIEKELK